MTLTLQHSGPAQTSARVVADRSIAGLISICIAIMARNSEVPAG